MKNARAGGRARARHHLAARAALLFSIVVLAVAAVVLLVSGCGSSGTSASKNLASSVNQLDIKIAKPTTVMVKGTVQKTETGANSTFAEINVSSMQNIENPDAVGQTSLVKPGTLAVIEIRDPKVKVASGHKVEAAVQVVKAPQGYKLFAQQVLVK